MPSEKQPKLTEENLSRVGQSEKKSVASSKQPSLKSKPVKAGKKVKPAWATTEKDQENEKEAEIDDLLEFAYELDYDKFMDDFEVR